MEINPITVKSLRQEKGWTQQHLADACAISLRTVQRVEKEGSASNETLLGLCAVFEIEQKSLLVIPKPSHAQMQKVSLYGQWILFALATLIGGCVGALIMYLILG
ncbi:helix-turn-helix domain-containing protein [Shewanella pealeana]|uniref:Transcriptional regulator, XRE family n=1 Tax=Shewanella pealeana (strain ATCC 700345 / ANG-SQ1) TaxID=398579 RepID=A8H9J2_SHEPA|nr:helix-turn-helix transcriptional regulator [Shewanella pealeana]ABV89229.1 transcriptional regulator, XRE family [Shewanella pealeana ATCC 700345]